MSGAGCAVPTNFVYKWCTIALTWSTRRRGACGLQRRMVGAELGLPLAIVATVVALVLHLLWPEPPPPAVIAIDLGTTFSSVAYFRNGHGPELVADAQGRRVFPRYIVLRPRNETDIISCGRLHGERGAHWP